MTEDILAKQLEDLPWRDTFYWGHPHSYVHQEWLVNGSQVFDEVKLLIEREGYDKRFLKKMYRYVTIGDYTYWLMTPILNRVKGII